MRDKTQLFGIYLYLFAFLCFGSSEAAIAAGFDCSKAASVVEKMICDNKDLSKADEVLAEAYRDGLANSTDPHSLKASQRTWVKEVRGRCQDSACLQEAYAQRLAALRSSAADPAVGQEAAEKRDSAIDEQLEAGAVPNESEKANNDAAGDVGAQAHGSDPVTSLVGIELGSTVRDAMRVVGARCTRPFLTDDAINCPRAIDFFGAKVDLFLTISNGSAVLQGLRPFTMELANFKVEEITLKLSGDDHNQQVMNSLIAKYGGSTFKFGCSDIRPPAENDGGTMVVRCPENIFHDSRVHYESEFFANGQIELLLSTQSSLIYRNEQRAAVRLEQLKEVLKRGQKFLQDNSLKVGAEGL